MCHYDSYSLQTRWLNFPALDRPFCGGEKDEAKANYAMIDDPSLLSLKEVNRRGNNTESYRRWNAPDELQNHIDLYNFGSEDILANRQKEKIGKPTTGEIYLHV